MTATIFERNAAGTVSFGDGASIQVPRDVSALSVLGHAYNEAFNGDVFAEDHWVYRDGKKQRKWFTSTHDIKSLWPPHLDELARIEALYQRYLAKQQNVWKDRVEAAVERYLDMGIKHADLVVDGEFFYSYEFEKSKNRECRFVFSSCMPFDKPKKHEHKEIATEFRAIDRYHTLVCWRLGTVRAYLDAALKKKIGRPERPETVFCVEVNGRSYFYRSADNGYGYYGLEKISWPADDVVVIEHTGA